MGLTGKLGNSRKSRKVLDVPAKTLALKLTKRSGYNLTSAQAGGFPRGSGRESSERSVAGAAMRFLGSAFFFAGAAANRSVVSLEGSGCLRFLGLAFFFAGAAANRSGVSLVGSGCLRFLGLAFSLAGAG